MTDQRVNKTRFYLCTFIRSAQCTTLYLLCISSVILSASNREILWNRSKGISKLTTICLLRVHTFIFWSAYIIVKQHTPIGGMNEVQRRSLSLYEDLVHFHAHVRVIVFSGTEISLNKRIRAGIETFCYNHHSVPPAVWRRRLVGEVILCIVQTIKCALVK